MRQTDLVEANHARARRLAAATTLDGVVELVEEDYADGRSRSRHVLRTTKGRVELKFAHASAAPQAGARVRVRGRRQGDALIVEALDDSGQTSASSTQASTTLPNVLGEQKVAVILVNFQDDASQPVSREAAHALVFDSVNKFFQEGSFGQTWLAGQTFNWVTIPVSKTICDTFVLSNEADKAVVAAGGNLAGFNRKLYMFPKNACGWTGMALVAENPSQAWINGSFTLKAVGHELGHNLGLRHAHGLDCDASPTGNTCIKLPYGDTADLMGNVRTGQFSAFARERLGWLNDGVSPPILLADRGGRYSIEPYAGSSVGAKAVKVPRGTDANGRMQWFYLEYRQVVGVDTVLSGAGNLTQGVMVRTATTGDGDSSYQLDMTPGSATGSSVELADGALAVGRSYTDPLSGVTISLASASTTGAAIDVSFPASAQPSCQRMAPTVSLTGPGSGFAGATLDYTVTVTNRDSSGCAAGSFSLAGNVPTGWTGALQATSVSLSPGASATLGFSVTSPASASLGSYGVGVGASNGDSGTGSAGASYSVQTATASASVGTDRSAYLRGNTVYMSARVLMNGAPVAGASVTFRVTKANGNVVKLVATTDANGYARARQLLNKWTDPVGGYSVRADVASASGAASDSSGFAVN